VAQVQLASPQALAVYRSLIPEVEDGGLNQVLHDPRTIWYTGTEMPRAYQFDSQGDGRMGAHSADYNIAPKRGDVLNGQRVSRDFDPHGNGNGWLNMVVAGAVPLLTVIAAWSSLASDLSVVKTQVHALEKRVDKQEDADSEFQEYVRQRLEEIAVSIAKISKD